MTENKKWVMNRKVKRLRTVCRPSDPPTSTSKAELHPIRYYWECGGMCRKKFTVVGPATQPNHQYCLLLSTVIQAAFKFGSKMVKCHQSSGCNSSS
ncbi:hypothetical protein TNCV_4378911 [Trichonephila clavipes]|nr:hypothetical protein TNCV_4378911 [Trichonephila clavipes]